MQLDNTAALVTGGASGLGAATAAALAAQGRLASSPSTCRPSIDNAADRRRRHLRRRPTSPTPTQVRSAPSSRPRRTGAAAHRRQLRRHRPVGADPGQEGRARPRRSTPTVVQVNLVGTFNVLALAAERDRADRPRRAGPARRHREHRLHRGVRRPGRPGGVRLVQGRHRRPHPAGGAGPGAVRHPGLHDRARASSRPRCWPPSRRSSGPAWPPACRSRSGSRGPTSTPQLALAIIDHDYLNGEVIRMDGALRMAPALTHPA